MTLFTPTEWAVILGGLAVGLLATCAYMVVLWRIELGLRRATEDALEQAYEHNRTLLDIMCAAARKAFAAPDFDQRADAFLADAREAARREE